MKHRERLETCLSGSQPDRVPVALWRHFPVDDMQTNTMVEAHLNFQKTYDFDLLKITSPSGFFNYDWGVVDEWRGNMEGTRVYVDWVVKQAGDWEKLPILDPHEGFLGKQLKAIQLITEALGPDTPVVATIFNPLSVAKKLVGEANLNHHIQENPEALHKGLEIVTESIRRFVQAAIKAQVAGVFLAIQHAQRNVLSVEQYTEFGRAYDLPVLEAASPLWLNMLHLHGKDVMFKELTDYPVAVINWHDMETPPGLAEAKTRFPGVVCGGLRQWDTMVLGTPEQVEEEASAAIRTTEGQRFILGTGCVAQIVTPHGNLMAARRSVDD